MPPRIEDERLNDPKWLKEKYYVDGLSQTEIAEEVGCTRGTVRLRFQEFGIKGKEDMTLEEKFWAKVEQGNEDECWKWKGATSSGYGIINIDYEPVRAHRVSLELDSGDIDNWALHKCDNKLCVNPNHLYDGTPKDNSRDASKLSRDDVDEIIRMVESGMTRREVADEFNVDHSTITRIYNSE